jgi:murein L,D-transpeptidase YcbB/YkuD
MTMHTIVGRYYRRTPVFTGSMTYLVFSPFWNIPPGIAAKDILPQVKKDIGYLEKNHIRVLQGWGANTVPIDPATIDWSDITPAKLPYHFRQDPGPYNALGRVKFMFPNRFDVYLHDTPSRELFLKAVRDFSSGCISVENPAALAQYLLADRPAWSRAEIEAAMERNVERTVTITDPLPVHLLYWTAWASEDQEIHFRRDIYKRDKQVSKALQIASPDRGQYL